MWYWWDISENSTAAEFSQAYHVWASTSHPRSLPPPLQLLFAPALVVRLAPHSSWNSTSLATLPRKNKMISYEPPFSHNNAKATRLANKLPQNEFIFPKFQADFISWDPTRNLTMEEKNQASCVWQWPSLRFGGWNYEPHSEEVRKPSMLTGMSLSHREPNHHT